MVVICTVVFDSHNTYILYNDLIVIYGVCVQALVDGDRIEDIRRMYLLFGRVKSQAMLQQAWLQYCR